MRQCTKNAITKDILTINIYENTIPIKVQDLQCLSLHNSVK